MVTVSNLFVKRASLVCQPAPVAKWSEEPPMIATATTMTGAEFDALPYEDSRQWESLNGELVETPAANAEHQGIVVRLILSLGPYLQSGPFSGIYPDVEFALGPNLRLRPDLAVILGDHWRTLNPKANPLLLPPDIAIEVILPSERAVESTRKARTYLLAGVSEVWQVFPDPAVISFTAAAPPSPFLKERTR